MSKHKCASVSQGPAFGLGPFKLLYLLHKAFLLLLPRTGVEDSECQATILLLESRGLVCFSVTFNIICVCCFCWDHRCVLSCPCMERDQMQGFVHSVDGHRVGIAQDDLELAAASPPSPPQSAGELQA